MGLPVLDNTHLDRQTGGDRDLATELLQLFRAQLDHTQAALSADERRADRRDVVHTLKGSASAVGAWRVVRAAEAAEAALQADARHAPAPLRDLAAAIGEARQAVVEELSRRG